MASSTQIPTPALTAATQPKAAFGYARVSSQAQADSRLSITAQQERIAAMARLQEIELTEIITDAGESAGTLERPGIQRVLELLQKRELKILVIAKLDRVTRSVRDLGELLQKFQQADARLISVAESLDTKTAAGRLVIHILCSVAQWEREAGGERVKEALRSLKAQGRCAGEIPFGMRLSGPDGKGKKSRSGRPLILDPREQEIRAIAQRHRAAGQSLQQIAWFLNNEGFRTRRGGPWEKEYIRRILIHQDHGA